MDFGWQMIEPIVHERFAQNPIIPLHRFSPSQTNVSDFGDRWLNNNNRGTNNPNSSDDWIRYDICCGIGAFIHFLQSVTVESDTT